MNITEIPFEAYQGAKPYIFISYAHKDSQKVYPIIKKLHDMGYNIWYDEGIDPGQEWLEEIANALSNCSQFVVFISNNSIKSINVKKEVFASVNRIHNFLAIHIEDTVLPFDWEMNISIYQAILYYKMSMTSFVRKIQKTFPDKLKSTAVLDKKTEVLTALVKSEMPMDIDKKIKMFQLYSDARENVAMSIHNEYIERMKSINAPIYVQEAWEELEDSLKESNKMQVDDMMNTLFLADYGIKIKSENDKPINFTDNEIEILARAEHERYVSAKKEFGWVYGKVRDASRMTDPYLLEWDELDNNAQDKDKSI